MLNDNGETSLAHQTCREDGRMGSEMGSEDYEVDGQDDEQGTGEYATLHVSGAQSSAGSTGHPDECMPCTFYCFTRRGCNRGQDCRFCHLTHQSKLQLRREAWKRQQREKRKSIRERVAQETLARRTTPLTRTNIGDNDRHGCNTGVANNFHESLQNVAAMSNGQAGKNRMLKNLVSKADQGEMGVDFGSKGQLYSDFNVPHFTYTPGQATLTIGQFIEIWPKMAEVPLRFQLGTPLPAGLSLDHTNGVIRGAPLQAAPKSTVVVQAILANNRMMRGIVDIDVVDFTRGGYVIGHMSEIEPGRFMMLLYVPEGTEDVGEVSGSHQQFSESGGRPARKPASSKRAEQPPSLGAWSAQVARGHHNYHNGGFHDKELLHEQMVEPSSAFMQRF